MQELQVQSNSTDPTPKKETRIFSKVLNALGWPIFWGTAAYVGLLVSIKNGIITNELLIRYLTSHAVSYIASAMFCVGVAALLLRSFEVINQMFSLGRINLKNEGGEDALQVANSFSRQLREMRKSAQGSYLWKRLHDATSTVCRNESAEGLEDELKYLADLDAGRQQDGYSLVRILIWAIPMLGFLGTVIGISDALGNIGVDAQGNFDSMMEGLSSALYVAFDTTALALTLSIIMMFGQFFVDRFETQLLDTVDRKSTQQLMPAFAQFGHSSDPYLVSLHRMSEAVLKSIETYQRNQTKIWEKSIKDTLATWNNGFQANSAAVSELVTGAIKDSVTSFSDRIGATIGEADNRMGNRWKQWQVSMSENARAMAGQQTELRRQAELLDKAVGSCREIITKVGQSRDSAQSIEQARDVERNLTVLVDAIRKGEPVQNASDAKAAKVTTPANSMNQKSHQAESETRDPKTIPLRPVRALSLKGLRKQPKSSSSNRKVA